MATYPKPKPSELKAAFRDHKVNFTEHRTINNGRNAWTSGLRAATVHHTAGKNSVGHLASFNWGGANCVIQHGGYNGKASDGKAVILCWGSCWHSGAGGPWPGVAGKDSLHLVSWGIEIESLGTKKDITAKQVENVARMLAALVDLGMPLQAGIHRHADWTDGTGPVGGYPLSTRGRKIDTNKTWYPTKFWVDQAKKRVKPSKYFDGRVPDCAGSQRASDDPELKNPQAWRWACKPADLGWYAGAPKPKGEQGWPRKAIQTYQASQGYEPTGNWGPKLHRQWFGAEC